MTKICMNCKRSVDDSTKYCPYCKSQRFRNQNEIVKKDSSISHTLFYNYYDGYYILSKAKVVAIATFLIFMLASLIPPFTGGVIAVSAIIAALVYLIGFSIRKIIGKPSQVKLEYNNYGLATDLYHLLFCWQNRQGGYVISKTKIVSHVVFIGFFIASFSFKIGSLFAAVFFGLVFETPAFLIGYVIHKITNPNPEALPKPVEPKRKIEKPNEVPNVETPVREVIGEYEGYKRQLNELNSKFAAKEKAARNIIEKRFEPPQLTYTRFIGGVDRSKELFNKNYESAMTMIELADDYSPRIVSEIEEKIDILNQILAKLDSLSSELIINEDLSEEGDVDGLIDDMDNLIDSVKDYSQK